tara:strand:- start:942 stop:1139 length:198 start_codon:yes stop_codon:yes gene_type:complete
MHSKSLSDSLFAKYCYVHFEALSARRNKVSKDNREGKTGDYKFTSYEKVSWITRQEWELFEKEFL